ncbi:MmcQ/YjbR family DNA-binding protein [Echinicola jeungdonensis]|uniref:MmcQ/YjbR family DNA-binding protein n=1 Tax=Echinicola jeungdonensis TaxID=709343 RepID=A0ABV5J6X0_9BACT|nr:MmcQ/YjbR family DNA-binding protein [Echinicola jeungdonensis]MDN3669784.1 MmcQ/YjbR family DNA-binding protein [Echinicola jeungdonensis]
MDIIYFRDYCMAKPGVTEDTPFDEDTLCFKLGGKIFAITGIAQFEYINLKCDPERAMELREQYEGISPGYHMNKKHWNSVYIQRGVPDPLILELTDHSYELIYQSLPQKVKNSITT